MRDPPHEPPLRCYTEERQAAIVVLACQAPSALGWDLVQYIRP